LAILSILLILLIMVILQNLSKLVRRHKIPFISICQLLYAVALYFFMDVPYTFTVQFKGFFYFLLVFATMVFLGDLLKAQQMRFYKKISFSDLLFIGIALPVSEEIIFRGALLFLLPSVLLNAAIFSCVHLANVFSRMEKFSVFNFAYRFAAGYIFAYSAISTQSLFCPILCHVLNNSVGLLMLSRSEHVAKKSANTTNYEDSEHRD